jgi:hypothetical protein
MKVPYLVKGGEASIALLAVAEHSPALLPALKPYDPGLLFEQWQWGRLPASWPDQTQKASTQVSLEDLYETRLRTCNSHPARRRTWDNRDTGT